LSHFLTSNFSKARLKSVEFHPSARVLLTAGLNQKLTLFQVDGKKNSKIQTIFIEKFPILAAHFTKLSGDEIIMGSRHKNFYYYDMMSGKICHVIPPIKALDEQQRPSMSTNFEISPDNRLIAFVGSQGQIHLFSCKSKEWIDTVKINGTCNAVAFSPDSRYLFACGGKSIILDELTFF
jgi:WD40 repeat protein